MKLISLNMEQEPIAFTGWVSEPDWHWRFTDKQGHLHLWMDQKLFMAGEKPDYRVVTLYEHEEEYWCGSCCDEHVRSVYYCKQCGEEIEPKWYTRTVHETIAGRQEVSGVAEMSLEEYKEIEQQNGEFRLVDQKFGKLGPDGIMVHGFTTLMEPNLNHDVDVPMCTVQFNAGKVTVLGDK